MPRRKEKWREILLYSDSEPNEILIGVFHMTILPFALLEIGVGWIGLRVFAHLVGAFQLFAVLFNGSLGLRKVATFLAALMAVATCANYTMAGMMHGSHLAWLVILIFSIWNLVRVTTEYIKKRTFVYEFYLDEEC